MPVLRNVVARLGVEYDPDGADEAERSIKKITKSLFGLAAVIATAAGAFKLIGLASDAQEALNVMNFAFGESTEKVKAWATEFGNAAGRSEFALRKTASTLGAVLNPLMDQNQEAAANMSMGLAQLSVDLGSFFDVADENALVALRSGLVGEMEPLRRFGVVMTQDALSAFALSQGLSSNVMNMDIATKTMLRYNFIMQETAIAQGDAERTSMNWANSTKALQGALHEMGTNAGMVLLPVAEKILIWARDLTKAFSKLAKETDIVKAIMITLGGLAVGLGIKMAIAWAPALATILLMAAGFVLAILVVEDFIGLLTGKKSAIGHFINQIFGPGSAEDAVRNLKDAFEGMVLYMENEVFPAWQSLGSLLGTWKDKANENINDFFNNLLSKFETAAVKMQEFAESLKDTLTEGAEWLGIDTDALGKAWDKSYKELNKGVSDMFNLEADSQGRTGLTQAMFGGSDDSVFEAGARTTGVDRERRENQAIKDEASNQALYATISKDVLRAGRSGSKDARKAIYEVSEELNINITGMSNKEAAKEVAAAVTEAGKKGNKKMLKALKQGAE